MLDPPDLLRWGVWRPLAGASRDPEIPHLPGLYRIRRMGRDDLDSTGQTGTGTMTLRKRLGMLRGVSGELMPYRDPHTAGPALWALSHQTGEDFEASVVPVEGSMPGARGWRHWLSRPIVSSMAAPRPSSSALCRPGIAPRPPTTGAVTRRGVTSAGHRDSRTERHEGS